MEASPNIINVVHVADEPQHLGETLEHVITHDTQQPSVPVVCQNRQPLEDAFHI